MQMDEYAGECLWLFLNTNGSDLVAFVLPEEKRDESTDCSKYDILVDSYNTNETLSYNINERLSNYEGMMYSASPQDFYDFFEENIQPYSTCSAQRDFCDDLNKFLPSLSPSFKYLPLGSNITFHEYADPPRAYALSNNDGSCNLDGVPDTDGAFSFYSRFSIARFLCFVATVDLIVFIS